VLLCIDRSLVFIWDSEAMQLHGVFRVDKTAPRLPSDEVPGKRPYQVAWEKGKGFGGGGGLNNAGRLAFISVKCYIYYL
jgi:hypothetical protein